MAFFFTRGDRVKENTPEVFNENIRRRSDAAILFYASHPEKIDERLEELENEWDIERYLESNAASFALAGVILGMLFNKKWLILPAAVTSFLLLHAVQGWCPPLPIFRRMGVRTKEEIMREYYALRALRGDFDDLQSLNEAPLYQKVDQLIRLIDHQI
ncbi:MAG: hypothetical protein WAN36_07210 [Calditrichia bacterium]